MKEKEVDVNRYAERLDEFKRLCDANRRSFRRMMMIILAPYLASEFKMLVWESVTGDTYKAKSAKHGGRAGTQCWHIKKRQDGEVWLLTADALLKHQHWSDGPFESCVQAQEAAQAHEDLILKHREPEKELPTPRSLQPALAEAPIKSELEDLAVYDSEPPQKRPRKIKPEHLKAFTVASELVRGQWFPWRDAPVKFTIEIAKWNKILKPAMVLEAYYSVHGVIVKRVS